MSKKNRPRVIGDPLRKFKQPHKKNECPPAMRKMLEEMMELDHREGRPLRAALTTSSKSGMPDKWFFEKARALGYKFDNEFEFWSDQCKQVFALRTDHESDLDASVMRTEEKMRRQYGDEAFEAAVCHKYGTVIAWREEVKKIGEEAYQQGIAGAKLALEDKKARLH
jgi:hypothetical protein